MKKRSRNKEYHVVLDLETLGTGPGCVILSIGAVLLSPAGVEDTFYQVIDLDSSMSHGLKVDPDTLIWWQEQSVEARVAVFVSDAYTLGSVLQSFAKWLPRDRNFEIWGNGPDFDNAILNHAYTVCRIKCPWDFWRNQSIRTARLMHPEVEAPPFPAEKTKHHALHDAEYEAEILYQILSKSWGTCP